ncbi:hypothetical protein SN16_07595 [Salinicoccus roseus]|uniref:2-methylcitrate dehydratase n=2 Tax=Salinicoccus roseus TaxID=45670 RepID=A0A0C2E5E5_9STAP|nr:hypothetical protein SN16_07595 [Salinicoccus roseus]
MIWRKKMKYDEVVETLASYIVKKWEFDNGTKNIAKLILKDSMGCMVKSLNNNQCKKMLGPVENGAYVERGIMVPGQRKGLGLLDASWNLGILVRWLDYNDCFLAEEWGHPSDNLGGIIAAAYHQAETGNKITVGDVLNFMIKAHEIQGVLSLCNSLNRNGYDHVFFVKLATAAVVSEILGGNEETIKNTIANVFADGAPLRIYRHAPNVTTRKSWAAGDATMRGVRMALLTKKLDEGYPNILTEPDWGFNANVMNDKNITVSRELGDYVVRNILFKADFPAEFHAQTGAEAAMRLSEKYNGRLDSIKEIRISTHESAVRIIAHKEKLTNPSDRDHSLEYIIAVALINGDLKTEYYYDEYHNSHPEIDQLIKKMKVIENPRYSNDYLDPEKRSVTNAVQLIFSDDEASELIEVEYPIGHKFRRSEVEPVIDRKFRSNVTGYFNTNEIEELDKLFDDEEKLFDMEIRDFMKKWVK